MRSSRNAGCLGVVLLLLVVVGLLAWVFRDDLLRRWSGSVEYTEVSPAAAESGEAKLERLRTRGDTIRLTETELASLLQYRLLGQFPEMLQNPSAAMSGDTLRVGGRVPTEMLPDLQELERVRAFLPDTTRIDLTGRFLPREPGNAAVEFEEVAVAGVPIPRRYYPSVLERLGRRDEPGLPPNAMVLPLPRGVGSVWVENGELVMTP
jgi:hypothetical protein